MFMPHNPYLKQRDNVFYKIYEYSAGRPSKVISGDIEGVYATETLAPIKPPVTGDVQYNFNKRQNKTEIIITSNRAKAVKTPYLSPEGLLYSQEPNDSGGKAIWRYYFDQHGNDTLITFRIVDKNDSIRLYWKNSYKYDEDKNIVEHSSYDWRVQYKGKPKRHTYVYDRYGNWTSRLLYINDQIQETTSRKIDYRYSGN
jgi:hypothetical protein